MAASKWKDVWVCRDNKTVNGKWVAWDQVIVFPYSCDADLKKDNDGLWCDRGDSLGRFLEVVTYDEFVARYGHGVAPRRGKRYNCLLEM